MSSNDLQWNWTSCDNSRKSNIRKISSRTVVVQHPLQKFQSYVQVPSNKNSDQLNNSIGKRKPTFVDPLGLLLDGDDPLSLFQKRAIVIGSDEYDEDGDVRKLHNEGGYRTSQSWETKKDEILSNFNARGISPLSNCFGFPNQNQSNRGNQTIEFDDEMSLDQHEFSPQEFQTKMKLFHNEMIRSWGEEQRVKAIKIAIQCSKLLSDPYACSFFPIKFVYITDILDTFGMLVYTRLKVKCQEAWKPTTRNGEVLKLFPEEFTLDLVTESAREMCHNWFYKVTSIRELIPRLYLEIALLRSYRFIKTGMYESILSRLTKMIRGVGDPLVNIYLRCYLCRVAILHCPNEGFDFFAENFFEFVAIYPTIFSDLNLIEVLRKTQMHDYIEAFVPALEWIVRGVIANDENAQYSLFDSFQTTQHNSLLLLVVISSFKSSFIISKIGAIIKWIDNSNIDEVPLHKSLKQLGICYDKYLNDNLTIIDRDILLPIWQYINHIVPINDFLTCVELWLPISVNNLSIKQIDPLLNYIVQHVGKMNEQKYYPILENILRNLLDTMQDFFSFVISVENLMPFVRIFRDTTNKVKICKMIMDSFVKKDSQMHIQDKIVLNNLMTISKWLHDSIDALTPEDERKQIGKILSIFVIRVDFGQDFQQQLDFFVDARGTFFNLDPVHVMLVHRVNKLSLDVLKIVSGRHTSKTSAFVRACAAFSFITIPSIKSSNSRIQLYIISGQTALANQCLGQADAFFKAAIETILDFPKKIKIGESEKVSDHILMTYIRDLFSVLLVVPDNPSESKQVALIRLLINTILKYHWEEPNAAKTSLYIQGINVLCILGQNVYPYHYANVESNDVLYAYDEEFKREINSMCSVLLDQIFKCLIKLAEEGKFKQQAKLAYELLLCILLRGDISNDEMAKLSVKLWKLTNKYEASDPSVAVKTLKNCVKMAEPESKQVEVFSKLLSVIK